MLESLSGEQRNWFSQVSASKAHASWQIYAQAQSLHKNKFLSFSAMSTLGGAVGQVNYTAANAYLEGLMYWSQ